MLSTNVGIYIRVSTQEQANEGYSIDAQRDRLTAYCRSRAWNIYNIYIDGGFSGSNMSRPALSQLLDDIKAKRVNCVLVYKLDRLSRSQKDTLYIIEDIFLKNGIDFVSLNENFDTSSPFGRAMIGILSVFAQLEREQIKERSMMGRVERAKNGLWHGGGHEPFGYNYIDGQLIINDYESAIVKDIFELFNDKIPIYQIQQIISNKYGKDFHESVIRSTLSMVLYTGKISYGGETYDGQHDAIISTETFKHAQDLLEIRKKKYHNRPFKSKTLLGGLLYCAHCGARYLAKGNYSGRGANRSYRPYYTCYSRAKSNKKYIIDPNCKNPSYAVPVLDDIILNEIRKLFTCHDYFESIVQSSAPPPAPNNDLEIELLSKQIISIQGQISRLLDLYQLDGITIDDIHDRINSLQEEKVKLQETITKLSTPQLPETNKKLSPSDVLSLKDSFESIVSSDDMSAKQNLVHTLIQKILVNEEENSFEIIWNF